MTTSRHEELCGNSGGDVKDFPDNLANPRMCNVYVSCSTAGVSFLKTGNAGLFI